MIDRGLELKELLIAWIKDAHAMEPAHETMLEFQLKQASAFPEYQDRIRTHLRVTREQTARLETCLRRNAADASVAMDLMGKASGFLDAASFGVGADSVLKGLLIGIGAEYYEMACYRSLAAADVAR